MRRLLAIILSAISITAAGAEYADMQLRANRFFDQREWASATAYYNYMLKDRPDVVDTYGRDIVSYLMLNDTVQPPRLLSMAMAHRVPLDSVLTAVQRYAFIVGDGSVYERYILQTAKDSPWLARPLDAYLLRYYTFRNNGPMIVEYARRMLAGLPDNIAYLASLAQGYLLDNRGPEALETWLRILELQPDNYDALVNAAAYYDVTGDGADALPLLRRAAAIRSTPYVERQIQRLSANE